MATVGDINPQTGQRYSPQEIMRINSGLDPTTGLGVGNGAMGTTPTTPTGVTAPTGDIPNWEDYLSSIQVDGEVPEGMSMMQIKEDYRALFATPPGTAPTAMPTFGEGAAAGIPIPEITPAPAYEPSAQEQEFMETYGTILTDWVTSGGYGLEPEVQAQMIQQQTDTLKAREQENIRVMTNNMERRGITNSGYLQANTNMITSNTTVALAGAIADVQIKSVLLKMASFEKAMGAAAQFLGYLSEQSQLAYAPEFATWQAEQLATMQTWQGKMDLYKMELNQAYQTQNIQLQGEIQSQLNVEQNEFNLLLAEMEIEANQKIALYQGIGGIFGTILGFIFGK